MADARFIYTGEGVLLLLIIESIFKSYPPPASGEQPKTDGNRQKKNAEGNTCVGIVAILVALWNVFYCFDAIVNG